ncbi:hypothetical protein HDU98_010871 [Podochytrium sp. JEL0797]|nr:hypothetical protein HDU98_010871 [Podochytrium sp. JEL0797]
MPAFISATVSSLSALCSLSFFMTIGLSQMAVIPAFLFSVSFVMDVVRGDVSSAQPRPLARSAMCALASIAIKLVWFCLPELPAGASQFVQANAILGLLFLYLRYAQLYLTMAPCKTTVATHAFLAHYLIKSTFVLVLILDRVFDLIQLFPNVSFVVAAVESMIPYLLSVAWLAEGGVMLLEPVLQRLDQENDELVAIERQLNGVVSEAGALVAVRSTILVEEKLKC